MFAYVCITSKKNQNDSNLWPRKLDGAANLGIRISSDAHHQALCNSSSVLRWSKHLLNRPKNQTKYQDLEVLHGFSFWSTIGWTPSEAWPSFILRRLAQMKWKREQALQQMEKLAKIECLDSGDIIRCDCMGHMICNDHPLILEWGRCQKCNGGALQRSPRAHRRTPSWRMNRDTQWHKVSLCEFMHRDVSLGALFSSSINFNPYSQGYLRLLVKCKLTFSGTTAWLMSHLHVEVASSLALSK